MPGYMRWLVLGWCLALVLQGGAAEYLGRVAFLRDGALWVQELPEGKPRQVSEKGALFPRLSNSGRWLFYVVGTENRVMDLAQAQASPRTLAQCLGPCWSPTDDWLAYTHEHGGLFLMRAGDWRERVLIPEHPHETIEDFIWSPDGAQLCFVRYRTPGAYEDRLADLCMIQVKNGTATHLVARPSAWPGLPAGRMVRR